MNRPRMHSPPFDLDPVEMQVRDLVRIPCEVRTETGAKLLVTVEGKIVWIPREVLEEVKRDYRRDDQAYQGSVVVPRAWALEQGLIR